MLISYRCISGLMPNLIKKSWMVSTEDLNDHELGCVFRLAYCPSSSCKIGKMVFKDIADHYTSIHCSDLPRSFTPNNCKTITVYQTKKEERLNWVHWVKKIELNGSVCFYLITELDQNGLHSWVYIHGSPHEAKGQLNSEWIYENINLPK